MHLAHSGSRYPISRRGFLRVSAAGVIASTGGMPLLLNACAPVAPSGGPAGVTTSAGTQSGKAASPWPAYIPFNSGPRPDYHVDDPRYDDGFDNYPANPFKSVHTPPGSGSTVNILVAAYFPPPTPYEQNPTWQEVNRQLNADVRMNVVPVAGNFYNSKFATVMASDDLPDIMHIFFGWTLAPNMPQFFKAKCADLTPYLAGDAAREYPYLAAIPTYAWKNSVSALDGRLYLVPIQRHLGAFLPSGGYFFRNVDIWDQEIGADYMPKNADDFKRVLRQLNRPQENRAAFGQQPGFLFGLSGFAQMFGAPNNWKQDASGKLIKDRETEEYKEAVGYLRDLITEGLVPADLATMSNARNDFVAKKFAVSMEGYGNSLVDLWRRGLQQQPPSRFAMIKPFAAHDGGKPQTYLSQGYVSMNVLKKASPERIQELLRLLNFLAAPFGSQESTLVKYGIQGDDYTLDDKGNPQPTPEGVSRTAYVPWRYIAEHPWVNYVADLPGFARASHEAQQTILPIGVQDPTVGFYSPLNFGRGVTVNTAFNDGLREILLGRKPLSDYDGLVRDWASAAGDQIRQEYTEAMAATS